MMDDERRLELIAKVVKCCQKFDKLRQDGEPAFSIYYSRGLKDTVHFLWERRKGSKIRCAEFRSKAAVAAGLAFGKRRIVYDHAIPFSYLQAELLRLEDFKLLRDILNKYCRVALITKDEDQRLNAVGYRSTMPANWDQNDPLARYKAVCPVIDVEPNTP